jgi:hypothetical protein
MERYGTMGFFASMEPSVDVGFPTGTVFDLATIWEAISNMGLAKKCDTPKMAMIRHKRIIPWIVW